MGDPSSSVRGRKKAASPPSVLPWDQIQNVLALDAVNPDDSKAITDLVIEPLRQHMENGPGEASSLRMRLLEATGEAQALRGKIVMLEDYGASLHRGYLEMENKMAGMRNEFLNMMMRCSENYRRATETMNAKVKDLDEERKRLCSLPPAQIAAPPDLAIQQQQQEESPGKRARSNEGAAVSPPVADNSRIQALLTASRAEVDQLKKDVSERDATIRALKSKLEISDNALRKLRNQSKPTIMGRN